MLLAAPGTNPTLCNVGSSSNAAKASVNFDTKDHSPKAPAAAGATFSMRWAKSAGSKVMSAPRATPEARQISAKAATSPAPKNTAPLKAAIARTMPHSKTVRGPWRVASLAQIGALAAAARKNSNSNGPSAPGASRRLSTKNKNKVELIATGAALTKATSSSRRATGSAKTTPNPRSGRAIGRHSRRMAHAAPRQARAKHMAKAPKPPSAKGATAARQIPNSAPVSRQRASCKKPCGPNCGAQATPWA